MAHGKKRRPRGSGGYREVRPGVWEIYWREQRGGRLRTKRVYGDVAVARRELDKRLGERHAKQPLVAEDVTFGAYAKEWIEERRGTLRYSTWQLEKGMLDVHLLPAFEDDRLDEITTRHVRRYAAGKLTGTPVIPTRNGRGETEPGGRRARPQSVKHHLKILSQIFDQAVSDHLAHRNPVRDVKRPKVDRRQMTPLTPSEVRAFLSETPPQHRMLMLLLVGLGLRIGEALALRWSDYDAERRTLHITAGLALSDSGFERSQPKTPNAVRSLKLGMALHRALLEHRHHQTAPNPRELIFPGPDGGYGDRRFIRREVFRPAIATMRIKQLSEAQFGLLLEHVPAELHLGVRLLRLPGMSFRPLVALTRDAFDPRTGTLTYHDQDGAEHAEQLAPELRVELTEYVARSARLVDARNALLIGVSGGPVSVRDFAQQALVDGLRESNLVPELRLHDLRHTYVSAAIRAGASPKQVSRNIGHSDPGFTLRVYTHFFDEQLNEEADHGDLYL